MRVRVRMRAFVRNSPPFEGLSGGQQQLIERTAVPFRSMGRNCRRLLLLLLLLMLLFLHAIMDETVSPLARLARVATLSTLRANGSDIFKPELTVTWSIIGLQCDDNASLGRRLSCSCSRWHSVVP